MGYVYIHTEHAHPFLLIGSIYILDFWAGALCEFDQIAKTKKLSHHVQHGIPPSIRGMVWQLMSNSKNAELEERYLELLNAPSPYDKMIQRDLARTFPGHKFFKERDGVGQEGLYNVVRSYSVYDQEVGYCQGLAFVVGPLLLNVSIRSIFRHAGPIFLNIYFLACVCI